MTISSPFASHERLFAEYLVQHPFNDEIHAEYRCPEVDQDHILEAYFTPQELERIRALRERETTVRA